MQSDAAREIQKSRAERDASYSEFRSTVETSHAELIAAHEKRLADIEATYRERINVIAPVQYWERKGFGHLIVAVMAVALFALLVYIGQGAIASSGPHLEQIMVKYGNPAIPVLILIGLPAFILIWIMRISIRIFIRNLALFDDAKERQAMIKTYLGLLVEEKKVSAEERVLVLQAIFRPGPAAGPDSDYAPPTWFDAVAKRMKP